MPGPRLPVDCSPSWHTWSMTRHGASEGAEPTGRAATGPGIQVVLTALAVLEHVAEHQPVGVSDLARAMGLPKSSAQRTLKTLQLAGWICPRSVDDTRWTLTPKVMSLGAKVGYVEALRAAAAEPMRALGAATGETVHLLVPDGMELQLVARVESIHPLQPVSHIGARGPMHATSGGKAILAAMLVAERTALLNATMKRMTANTIASLPKLEAELERVRSAGWAFNREEYRVGISSMGAAVVVGDRPIGAVTLSVPSTRLDRRRAKEYAPLLLAAVEEIERTLAASAA